MGRVEGKVTIVTGGASGLGKASCLLLAGEGAKVAVADVNDEAGQETAAEIEGNGGIARYWHIDVTDESNISKAFSEIDKEFGGINVLVNCAGISGKDKPSDELTEREWDRVIKVDLNGVFLCTKHAVPYIKKAGGGSIINFSSILGLVGGGDPAYHAAKGAVRLLTKSDAFYYGKYNIRVNSVHPGYISTPMFEGLVNHFPEVPETVKNNLCALTPLGRIGRPDDIAYGVLYLASDESSFVTGSELVIDGGVTSQ
jgi:NAD(P)-dependent dehydrogenase (short-subunit alcohol dehydrogenase family)